MLPRLSTVHSVASLSLQRWKLESSVTDLPELWVNALLGHWNLDETNSCSRKNGCLHHLKPKDVTKCGKCHQMPTN